MDNQKHGMLIKYLHIFIVHMVNKILVTYFIIFNYQKDTILHKDSFLW